jgi:hypothetical protein
METLAAAKGAVSPLNLVHDNGSEKKVNLIVDSRIDQLKDGMAMPLNRARATFFYGPVTPVLSHYSSPDNSVRLCCHPGSNGLTVYMTVCWFSHGRE